MTTVANPTFSIFFIPSLILLLIILMSSRHSLNEYKGILYFSSGIVFLGISYMLVLFQETNSLFLSCACYYLSMIISILMFSFGTFSFFKKSISKKFCFFLLSFFFVVYAILFYGEYSFILQIAASSLTLAFITFYTSRIIPYSFPQNFENTGLLILSIMFYGLYHLANAALSVASEFVPDFEISIHSTEILFTFTFLSMVGWIFGLLLIHIRDLEFDIDCYLDSLRRKDDERKEIEHQLLEINSNLAKQSRKDELTKLYNRRFIMAQFKTELARARRVYGAFSIVIIDLDLFKKVNDTYGHTFGDEVLVRISTLFMGSLREVDYIGRYGGEEFMVILPNTAIEQAFHIMERVRKEVQSLKWSHPGLVTTFSAGVLEINYDNANNSPTELIQIVDKCLYKAKSQGRNKVVAHDFQEG